MASPHPTLSLPPGPLWMVDDEPELVDATVAMLQRELPKGQVRGTTDPRDVAAWMEKERPAALITDVRMPHHNGLELVTRLHQKWGPVPVVVVTAYPSVQVNDDANAGRFAYLSKPFSFRSLRETLQRICACPPPSAFSGAIAVSMLDEVVQLYGLANRTGTLTVDSQLGSGSIGFENGRVVDARAGSLSGTPAFNAILSWSSGNFGWRGEAPREHTIQLSLSELLLEAYRLRDERAAGMGQVQELDLETELFGELDLDPVPETALAPASTGGVGNLDDKLSRLEKVEGFLGAAIFDARAGLCLAALNRKADRDLATEVAHHAELVEAKRRTISKLELSDEVQDIIISLKREYHLLRLSRQQPELFLYLVLDRARSNLAMARHLLADAERDLIF